VFTSSCTPNDMITRAHTHNNTHTHTARKCTFTSLRKHSSGCFSSAVASFATKSTNSSTTSNMSAQAKGKLFEQVAIDVLLRIGFHVHHTGSPHDGGIDFRGHCRLQGHPKATATTNSERSSSELEDLMSYPSTGKHNRNGSLLPVIGQCKFENSRIGSKYLRCVCVCVYLSVCQAGL